MPIPKAYHALEQELITNLLGVRRAEQEKFLATLRDPFLVARLSNDDAFVKIIQLALGDYGVRQSLLAERLGASTAQVGRWRAGKSVPPGYSRGMIIHTLADALESGLKSGESNSENDTMPAAKNMVSRPTAATLSDATLLEIGRQAGRDARRRARAAKVPIAVLEGDEVRLVEGEELPDRDEESDTVLCST